MALSAEVLENALAGVGIAQISPQELSHLDDHFFPVGIPLRANLSESFLDLPDRLAIVALENLPQVIRVEHTFGELIRTHGIQQLPRPRLAL